MTFFYDLNKRMAALATKQTLAEGKETNAAKDYDGDGKVESPKDEYQGSRIAAAKRAGKMSEGAKPDFLDIDGDGDKKEPMKKAAKDKELDEADYSAKKAAAGKDIGKPGKAFSKIAADAAGRYGSKEKGEKVAGAVLKKLRAKEDVNEDGIEEGFKEMDAWLEKRKKDQGTGKFDKKRISTGTVYTRRAEEEPEDDEDEASEKKKGRKTVGAGKGKKIGAKVKGTSKLSKLGSIAEQGPDGMVDSGEYGREGDMAKEQMHTIMSAAKELHSILSDEQDLPEWVQSKITKAMDYIDTARDYMLAQQAEGDEVVAEKAVSKQQQKFMGMAHAMQKGEKIKGASAELKKVAKTMKKSDVEDFAATKHKGLPKKVKADEEVEETAEAPKKAKGGIEFGKGIYESINSQVEKMIVEGMNVSVNMSTNEQGELTKNITVSAEGAEAETLAQLLNLAGMSPKESGCGCGQTPCGCSQVEEAYGDTDPTENKPDYPTDAETTGEDDELLRRWAGGLNKPKSTGQTTIPVIASQATRQVSEETKADKLGMNLYAELKQFKAK